VPAQLHGRSQQREGKVQGNESSLDSKAAMDESMNVALAGPGLAG
jgi:hypothetical protein